VLAGKDGNDAKVYLEKRVMDALKTIAEEKEPE